MKTKVNSEHVGLHVVTKRKIAGVLYWHHGILVGDGSVIHYATFQSARPGEVRRVKLRTFAAGEPVFVFPSPSDRPDLILSRAFARLGEKKYSLIDNNCEHFAYYCRTGESRSHQKREVVGLALNLTLSPFVPGAAIVLAGIAIHDHYNLQNNLTLLKNYKYLPNQYAM